MERQTDTTRVGSASCVTSAAKVKLAYTATQEVRAVPGGSGTVVATVDGRRVEIEVDGSPDSYRLLKVDAGRHRPIR